MGADAEWAVKTILAGPFIAIIAAAVYRAVEMIALATKPSGTHGPFTDSYYSLRATSSTLYALYQFASDIETMFAIVVLAGIAFSYFRAVTSGGY